MKKLLCFLLCSVLIFSSVSLCFAQDWSATDSQNLQNVAGRLYYMNQSAAYYLYNIATNTNNIYNKCVDIYNTLFNSGHNITYWVNAISTYMLPIYRAIQQTPLDLEKIYLSLGYTTDTDNDGNLEYHSFLNELNTKFGSYGPYTVWKLNGDNTVTYESWAARNFPSWMIDLMRRSQETFVTGFYNLTTRTAYGDASRTYYDWTDLSVDSYTPRSWADSQLILLSNIQKPLARLSYVLASDERIEAQEAAAANEEAVVDNFIDSSGDGAASPSDIGSVSDLSSGYKQNFGSDASPSGIFDIFNSDHATWFSQETKNQLDTTTPTRLTKGSESETPLLDKQIEDIYNALGVKQP